MPSNRTLAKKTRQNQVLELKLAGWDEPRIAEALDIKLATVKRDLAESLKQTEDAWQKNTEKVRLLIGTRLERLLTKFYKKAFDGDGDVESAEYSRKVIKDLRELYGTDLKTSDVMIDARNQTIVWDKDEKPHDLLEDKIRKFIERSERVTDTPASQEVN